MTDYERERAEKRAAYDTLYAGVAAALEGWSVDPTGSDGEDYRLKLVNEGQSIYLYLDRGRVNVSGGWPMVNPWPRGPSTSPGDVREDSPSITVSADKSPAKIAYDIARRFLPEYQRVFGLLEAKLQEDRNYVALKEANFQRVLSAAPRVAARRSSTDRAFWANLKLKDGYGHLEMSGKDSVTFEIRSVPVEVAKRILQALAEESK